MRALLTGESSWSNLEGLFGVEDDWSTVSWKDRGDVMRFDNATALGKHLREAGPDHLAPIYGVLCGEAFDRKKVFQGIVAAIKRSGEAQVVRLSGEERGVARGLAELESLSLFEEQKVVVIDEVDKASKEELAALERYVQRPSKGVFLIFGAALVRPLKGIMERGKREMVLLDLLKEKPWERRERKTQWLQGVAKRAGKDLSAEVMAFLFEEVGEELLSLEQEVLKLVTYVGERPVVSVEDARAVCTGDAKPKLWKVAEELVWDLNPGALSAVESATDLFMLIPMVRGQLQTGLKLHDCVERGEDVKSVLPRAFPKTIEKYKRLLKMRSKEFFRDGLLALFKCELMAKNSGHSPEFIWQHLCCQLLRDHVVSPS